LPHNDIFCNKEEIICSVFSENQVRDQVKLNNQN
jgi:hypothetical protein